MWTELEGSSKNVGAAYDPSNRQLLLFACYCWPQQASISSFTNGSVNHGSSNPRVFLRQNLRSQGSQTLNTARQQMGLNTTFKAEGGQFEERGHSTELIQSGSDQDYDTEDKKTQNAGHKRHAVGMEVADSTLEYMSQQYLQGLSDYCLSWCKMVLRDRTGRG